MFPILPTVQKELSGKNPEIIQKFTNAIQRGLEYVNTHSAEEIAETIKPQFKETDTATIATIIERYKEQDTWKTIRFSRRKASNFWKTSWKKQEN